MDYAYILFHHTANGDAFARISSDSIGEGILRCRAESAGHGIRVKRKRCAVHSPDSASRRSSLIGPDTRTVRPLAATIANRRKMKKDKNQQTVPAFEARFRRLKRFRFADKGRFQAGIPARASLVVSDVLISSSDRGFEIVRKVHRNHLNAPARLFIVGKPRLSRGTVKV